MEEVASIETEPSTNAAMEIDPHNTANEQVSLSASWRHDNYFVNKKRFREVGP